MQLLIKENYYLLPPLAHPFEHDILAKVFAPGFTGDLVYLVMINLLTTLTGLGNKFILNLGNLALISPTAPGLSLVSLAAARILSCLQNLDIGGGRGRSGTAMKSGAGKPLFLMILLGGSRFRKDETFGK